MKKERFYVSHYRYEQGEDGPIKVTFAVPVMGFRLSPVVFVFKADSEQLSDAVYYRGWVVSETLTGLKIAHDNKSKGAAISKSREIILRYGPDGMRRFVREAIASADHSQFAKDRERQENGSK